MYLTREEIRKAAGELITCGFVGSSLNSEIKEVLRETSAAGVIFFARNFESPAHLGELAEEFKHYRPDNPLLLSIDQEGGRVARVKEPATLWPPMKDLGTIDDPALTYEVGRALARELRGLNIDVNYAPVLDVDTNPDNPIIGDRSFGSHPELVSRHGAALIAGLQDHGVGACGKHFPGHGDTHLDSHLALPSVEHDLPRLRDVEWRPFHAAVKANAGAMMTAHVVLEAVDQNHPATLSPKVLQFLREEIGFEGVIISDDLEMNAVANHYTVEEMARLGLEAGVDHFLACKRPEVVLALYEGIIHAVEKEHISHKRLLESATRVREWKTRYRQSAVSTKERKWVGSEAHRNLTETIRSRAAMASY